ncbi:thiamine phosphate synthase [Dyadobacter sediminis]|uniref:Thiamine phosphate synthase n=1 Tax=Dyadobacter sediminis TaxID=1493691 RepID=A0A5R9KBU6_9BACT|nr:thiamine phosphate synthase [Dyadobacter sediminis]TLU92300.1 thiamine phosphate synthase [Dyadobacter sediminis]GGB95641.1 thiamine phosphate synthase [Dyadobacter sediminis]
MKLIIITGPEFIPDEARIINHLFYKGMACLHLRKPESSEAEFSALLEQIDPGFLDKTAIHQHHHLAGKFGINRLHFTEQNRIRTSPEQLELFVEKKYVLSTSVHQVNDIGKLSLHFSYTFFGPVFDSISKKGYHTSLPEAFYIDKELKKIPVIGLGGIAAANLEKAKEMNLDGVAVSGALWQNPAHAAENFTGLQNGIKQLSKIN